MVQKQHHPDAEIIHPVATGPAKDIVDKHQEPQPLKLYSGWFCPFVQRAWAILEEKKIPYQYIEVNPYHKEESFLKLNPRGLVPTLEYDGKPLFESTVICEFIEEAYPDYGPKLLPEDKYERARMRIWTDYVTSRIIPAFHRLLQYQSSGPDDEGYLKLRDEFQGFIKEFTGEMDPKGPFFMGDRPQNIDFIIAPWVTRFWLFDHFKHGLGIPAEGQGGKDEAIWARWRDFEKALENTKTIKETTSDKEHYLPIYQRYADDTAQSEMAKAMRSGRAVP